MAIGLAVFRTASDSGAPPVGRPRAMMDDRLCLRIELRPELASGQGLGLDHPNHPCSSRQRPQRIDEHHDSRYPTYEFDDGMMRECLKLPRCASL